MYQSIACFMFWWESPTSMYPELVAGTPFNLPLHYPFLLGPGG